MGTVSEMTESEVAVHTKNTKSWREVFTPEPPVEICPIPSMSVDLLSMFCSVSAYVIYCQKLHVIFTAANAHRAPVGGEYFLLEHLLNRSRP